MRRRDGAACESDVPCGCELGGCGVTLLAIDPGDTHSAYVIFHTGIPLEFEKINNAELADRIRNARRSHTRWRDIDRVAIEMIASYGMPVGKEVFETCLWIGRFAEAWESNVNDWPPAVVSLVYRREVKLHLCGSMKAKDGNVRQALIDRYGGKERAIGKKANPGPLFGVTADVWSALAIAVTYAETRKERA